MTAVDGTESDGGTRQAAAAEAVPAESIQEIPIEGSPESGRSRWKRRFLLAAVVATLLAAALILPPLINIGRYQRQITALMSRSLGRPVSLSSVEMRLLPVPGFILNDLSVSEDPAIGAEPILSARTVVATVRLLSLWKGKLEVNRISVDDASLNLVRTPKGQWNLESFLTSAAQNDPTHASLGRVPPSPSSSHFPYLEATNSRINLKNGLEKSPFSLIDTDLSLSQDDPGKWRLRLRGEPVRTDMEISSADTGEVRLDATFQSAPELRAMPLKLQLEWSDAQLGQLSRLLLGSDAGWRGDLTADVEVQGTLDAAQTRARLQATGVRRQEFAPETPLDLDASCTFEYQHSVNALHSVDCNTAIGPGQLHLKAEVPGNIQPAAMPQALVEVNHLPIQAGLDLLRTVRSGFAPGISASGEVNGSLLYKENFPSAANSKLRHAAKTPKSAVATQENPLTGSLTVKGGILKGDGLTDPISLPSIEWTPNRQLSGPPANPGLTTKFSLALPGTSQSAAQPVAELIAIQIGIDEKGYQATLGGSTGILKLRNLAYAFGFPHLEAVDAFTAGTTDLNLTGAGPWISEATTTGSISQAQSDTLTGSLQLHRAQWKAAFLASAVGLPQSAAILTSDAVHFHSDFTYPAAKPTSRIPVERSRVSASIAQPPPITGSATITAPFPCTTQGCQPTVALHFTTLDAPQLQAALLGPPSERSLLAPLIDRISSSQKPSWPSATVDVDADILLLGVVQIRKPQLRFKTGQTGQIGQTGQTSQTGQVGPGGAENEITIESWKATLLGGEAHGQGTFHLSGKLDGKPEYQLTADFSKIQPAALAALLNTQWTGSPISGSGTVRLSGLTAKDLAASATGKLQFNWPGGAIPAVTPATRTENSAFHFENWTGTLAIQNNSAQLAGSTLDSAHRKASLRGGMTFFGPVRIETGSPVPPPVQ